MHDTAAGDADPLDCRGAPQRLDAHLPLTVLLGLDADTWRAPDRSDAGFDAADDLPF